MSQNLREMVDEVIYAALKENVELTTLRRAIQGRYIDLDIEASESK